MIEKNDILTLIPQRPPFVLIDRMLSCDEVETVTEFTVGSDCLLQDNGVLQPWGMIENIAQSCAARIGFRSMQVGGKVGIGVIGSVSDMEIRCLPSVGDRIVTTVTVLDEVLNMTLISAVIASEGGQTYVSAKMKIALLP